MTPSSLTEEGFYQLLHANNSFLLSVMGDSKPKPTYEDLVAIERRRSKLIPKSYAGSVFVLLSWRPTVLRYLVFDFQFWITIAVYTADRFYVTELNLPVSALVIIVGFISFLLTFYLQNVLSRYFASNNTAKDCGGAILDSAYLCKTLFSEDKAIKIIKYMNVAYVTGFMELAPELFSFSNLLEPLNEKYDYLDEVDMTKLRLLRINDSGVYPREIISWTIDLIQEEVKAGKVSEYCAAQLYKKLFRLRGSIGDLFKFRSLPIPFVYVHFVYFLSFIYMPLFAILVADNFPNNPDIEVIGVLCVLLNCTFVIGLRDIGYRLSDPFGLHDEDFQVLGFITFATEESLRLFSSWAQAHIRESTTTGKAIYMKTPAPVTSNGISISIGDGDGIDDARVNQDI